MLEYIFIPPARAGVITDAPSLSTGFLKILDFLLSIAGILAIIGLVIAGALYFFSAGDLRRIDLAKRAAFMSVLGIIVVLGAWVVVRQITEFFVQ